ncbi:hypothetical protein AUG19_02005 [archaeon 13_1_20CM_2_54_9]|nr:MAG: hypothetical protein AUG19_02005 [archaeon 13_1_20CM_2_54_9]
MIDKNSVVNSLRGVLDPEIGISIVDLNMVRDVSIEGSHVKVTIALTVAHCPLAKTLQTDVEKALKKSNEVKSVTVETTAMSKTELNKLRTQLQNKAEKHNRHSIGQGWSRKIFRHQHVGRPASKARI